MIDLNKIKKIVELHFGLKDISIQSRKSNYVNARVTYMVLAKKLVKVSHTVIGDIIDRDHTTVTHGLNKTYSQWLATPAYFSKQIESLDKLHEDIVALMPDIVKEDNTAELLLQSYRTRSVIQKKQILELERVIDLKNKEIKKLMKYAPIW